MRGEEPTETPLGLHIELLLLGEKAVLFGGQLMMVQTAMDM